MTTLKSIIAIDGPAGSGKGTVAKIIAKKMGLLYVDTGAIYRALALKAKRSGISPENNEAIIALAKSSKIESFYDLTSGHLKVMLDNEDVSEQIRMPDITRHVAEISKIKEIREIMVEIQRKLVKDKKAILEGRDITTIVFPDAYKKFYLDADQKERVHRRYIELRSKNIAVNEVDIEEDIKLRDSTDAKREFGPLRRSPDAIYIDTTHMTIDEVVNRLTEEINKV
ncbi:MAG: (d)CMP kinase [Candidatus Omnitrophota bacterium]